MTARKHPFFHPAAQAVLDGARALYLPAGGADFSLEDLIRAIKKWKEAGFKTLPDAPELPAELIIPVGHFEVGQVVLDVLYEAGHEGLATALARELVQRVAEDTAVLWGQLDWALGVLETIVRFSEENGGLHEQPHGTVRVTIEAAAELAERLPLLRETYDERLDYCPGDLAEALQEQWVALRIINERGNIALHVHMGPGLWVTWVCSWNYTFEEWVGRWFGPDDSVDDRGNRNAGIDLENDPVRWKDLPPEQRPLLLEAWVEAKLGKNTGNWPWEQPGAGSDG